MQATRLEDGTFVLRLTEQEHDELVHALISAHREGLYQDPRVQDALVSAVREALPD